MKKKPRSSRRFGTPSSTTLAEEKDEKLLEDNLSHLRETLGDGSVALDYDEVTFDLFDTGEQSGKGSLLLSEEVCEWISRLLEYPDVRSRTMSILVDIIGRRQ